MPEMTFTVQWPDGRTDDCYSPSLVMWDHLEVGGAYPVADFVGRATTALDEAAQRVMARYGFACTSAMAERHRIGRVALGFAADATVRVVAMRPPLPVRA